MSFADYMRCALYHPKLGYYTRTRKRVGYRQETDFYTASSLGKVFSNLVYSALESLCGQDLGNFSFVELGPESEGGILSGMENPPFKEALQIRYGESFRLPSPCVVFSNELFDAQPFRRFIRHENSWREMGVSLISGELGWCHMPESVLPEALPESAPEGYLIDWPSSAHSLMEKIAAPGWSGLFVAFDYGLPLDIILNQRPEGTARTYSNHQMGTDLLDRPGHLDLTCHIIWDVMENALRENGFSDCQLEFQEAFFMHHSETALKRIIEAPQTGFSTEKQTLMELLHPGNMGRKFQVLHAKRGI